MAALFERGVSLGEVGTDLAMTLPVGAAWVVSVPIGQLHGFHHHVGIIVIIMDGVEVG